MATQEFAIKKGDSFQFKTGDIVQASIDSGKSFTPNNGNTVYYPAATIQSEPYNGTSETIYIGGFKYAPNEGILTGNYYGSPMTASLSLLDIQSGVVSYNENTEVLEGTWGLVDTLKVIREENNSGGNNMATKILTEAVGQVLANKIKANTTAIETLNGTGVGSVSKTVADEIAKVVASAPEDFDTLKEISDWISSHSDDASDMNSRITANETAIAALEAGTVTVDAALSASSENPVQNKVVSSAITTLQTAVQNLEDNALTVDTALSATSENPVQNKAVKAAIDDLDAKYELVTAAEAEAWFTPATP